MKNNLILSLFFLSILGHSQSTENIENQFVLNALFPGISYETGIAENTALKFDAGVSLGLIDFTGESFDIYPRLDAQLRHYYNFNRRASKNKNTKGNSANFFGLHSYYTSDAALLGSNFDPDLLNIVLFGPAGFETFYIGGTYGLQRSYPSGFNWGWQFGLGVISVDFTETGSNISVTDQFSVYPNFRVTAGWVIGAKKTK